MQDQRLDQILTIVDALADKVSDTGASVQALTEGRSGGDQSSVIHEELRDKARFQWFSLDFQAFLVVPWWFGASGSQVEELEGNLYGLAAQVQSQVDHKGRVATLRLMDQQQERHQVQCLENLELALRDVDARLERLLP